MGSLFDRSPPPLLNVRGLTLAGMKKEKLTRTKARGGVNRTPSFFKGFQPIDIKLGICNKCPVYFQLRWFETDFHFPFQLNFMKALLVCSKRLLLLVDSRCCNNLSTYQLLYSHWHFGCHGNLTGPQIHPISSIQLHFTQKVAGELPFLLHQNYLHIKDHFLRKFKKILSRGFGATLIFCNIKFYLKDDDS